MVFIGHYGFVKSIVTVEHVVCGEGICLPAMYRSDSTDGAATLMLSSMYRLYDGGAWTTGCTRVASFDRARGRSPCGLSKLKPRVCNQ